MPSPHSAGLIQVSIHPFQLLASLPLQLFAAVSSNPPPIAVHRFLFPFLIRPTLPPAFRFRSISPDSALPDLQNHLPAVITLVSHQLFWTGRRQNLQTGRFAHHCAHRLQVFDSLRQRFLHAVGIADIGALHRHRHHRPRFHIDGVFCFIGQVRTTVLHLGNARVGIVRIHPFFVGPLLSSLAVQSPHLGARRGLNS